MITKVSACFPDYSGEWLIARRNEALARFRAHKRESLLAATEEQPGLIFD